MRKYRAVTIVLPVRFAMITRMHWMSYTNSS
jgi:hypothetical protein